MMKNVHITEPLGEIVVGQLHIDESPTVRLWCLVQGHLDTWPGRAGNQSL